MSRMHTLRRGAGNPPIVFVHGFTCDHTDWAAQVAHFAPRHRVIACDLRGHGQTRATPDECTIPNFGSDVAELLVEEDLSGAILVGHSMGCRVVLKAAHDQPARVAGVVLVDGSKLALADGAGVEKKLRERIAAAGYANFVGGMFAQMFVPGTPSSVIDPIVKRAMDMDPAIGGSVFPRTPAWDAEHLDRVLRELQVPIVALQSTTMSADGQRVPMTRDATTPLLDALRANARDLRIEIIENLGHFTQIDAPDWVNDQIGQLITRTAR